MLAIKLQRVGKKHQPGYRLVVAEKRSKMLAPPVEDLGSYSPKTKQVNVSVSWEGDGAVTRSVSLTTLITENSTLP